MKTLSFNQKLQAIGFRIETKEVNPSKGACVDIEETLIECCGMIEQDSKLLSLLLSWVSVHGNRVVVEKLISRIKKLPSEDPRRIWITGVAAWAYGQGFHKWKSLLRFKGNKSWRFLYSEKLTRSACKRSSAEKGFEKMNILVPISSLRIRQDDALNAEELAIQNKFYRNRLYIGASLRADIITLIQKGAKTPYEIMNELKCSYEPAHRVFGEIKQFRNAA